MTIPDHTHSDAAHSDYEHSDYARIADAITFIANHVNSQPTLDEIAAHVHLSPFHFQRLFSRWAGVTPKRFLQVLTLERAKALLRESRPLLDVADAVGLSSSSRLYDHFVHLEAVTPGEYKQQGAGLIIEHAVHPTPFGNAFIAVTPRGICSLSFLDNREAGEPLAELHRTWPHAVMHENPQRTQTVIDTLFAMKTPPDRPISLHVTGTNFQISVWKALLQIPPGHCRQLFSGGRCHRPSQRGKSGRPGGWRQSGRLPDTLPPRHPTKWKNRRLPLGRNPKTRDTRLGIRKV
ncbi:hypothetical protein DZS_43350 [Dickeya ananatis]